MPPRTTLDRSELRKISQTTLAHYHDTAEGFWEGTRHHDVSQNIHALLSHLGSGPHRILDFGCGPGRDLRAFRDLGHEAVGLDGAARFVELEHYFRPPGRPRSQQPWLAMVCRKA